MLRWFEECEEEDAGRRFASNVGDCYAFLSAFIPAFSSSA
jgi:hypothetical protein